MLNSLEKVVTNFVKIAVATPIYPHWLTNRLWKKEMAYVKTLLKGEIIEVGAGDGAKRDYFCENNRNVTKYIATDFDDWDEEFENISKKTKNKLLSIILGYQPRGKLDIKCDAKDLPFKDNTFDFHLSFQVLEHIDEPKQYFKEAARVTKPNGNIIISVPFLYRVHGGEPKHEMDFFRYSLGFFYKMAKENNLELIDVKNYSGVGTSTATLVNQWFIRRISESKSILLKAIFAILGLPTIFIGNLIGFLLDLKPDSRFTTNFLVIYKKL